MDYFKKFLSLDPDKTLKEFRTKGDSYWKRIGEKMALQLFKEASKRVPAYKNFLKKNRVNPDNVKNINDFKKVPIMDKESYINKYKLSELCWDGKIESSYFLSASSGSTGIPNFWPRSTEQTFQGASISELIYREYFECDKKTTLYIVAFAMGMWIAGTYMAMSTEWVAQKGYPITVVTPGLDREEIFRLIKMGWQYYDQIVLVGYPPFVKDVVDYATDQGIEWKDNRIRFLFSGEAFTERWRTYLAEKVNLRNPLTDTINIYGSADVGLVAHETPLTNFIRGLAANNKGIMRSLFAAKRVPSVNQYDPHIRYFEKVGEELIVTSPSGLPLVRYNTKDIGDILYFSEVEKSLEEYGVNLTREFKKRRMSSLLWKTPIVYLFGRGKFSATIYGVTIFPEYVKFVLDNKKLANFLTGKYVISTEETKSHDQSLLLHVELKENKEATKELVSLTKEVFVNELPKISSEYKHLLGSMGMKVYPDIHLHSYGDPDYFPRGVIKKTA